MGFRCNEYAAKVGDSSGCESRSANRSLAENNESGEVEKVSSTHTYCGTSRNTTEKRHLLIEPFVTSHEDRLD